MFHVWGDRNNTLSSTSVQQCSWLVYGEITSDSNIGVGFGSVPDPEQAHFHVKVVKPGCRQFLSHTCSSRSSAWISCAGSTTSQVSSTSRRMRDCSPHSTDISCSMITRRWSSALYQRWVQRSKVRVHVWREGAWSNITCGGDYIFFQRIWEVDHAPLLWSAQTCITSLPGHVGGEDLRSFPHDLGMRLRHTSADISYPRSIPFSLLFLVLEERDWEQG